MSISQQPTCPHLQMNSVLPDVVTIKTMRPGDSDFRVRGEVVKEVARDGF